MAPRFGLNGSGSDSSRRPRERRHVPRLELAALEAGDAGDERQMVVQTPLLAALAGPRAHVTVIHWLGIVRGRDHVVVLSDRLLHLRADQPEVGGVVVNAVCVDRRVRVRRDDMEVLGRPALRGAEHLGVEAKLQDRAGASLARELGVDDLVRPRAKSARLFHAPHHVRPAVPATSRQSRLDDHVGARAHRVERSARPPRRGSFTSARSTMRRPAAWSDST